MPDLPARAPLIVIEGLDGAGTTTQSALLVEHLHAQGTPALLTREPSDGPIGALIRQMLAMRVVAPVFDAQGVEDANARKTAVGREPLALLFAADRLDHLNAEILPALARGVPVVSDRYYPSSFVYQGDPTSIDENPDALDLGWVQALNARATAPDLTIFLEASVDLCMSRLQGRARRDIFETRAQLARLERRYDQVMRDLEASGERIVRLDASLSKEALGAQISNLVAALLHK